MELQGGNMKNQILAEGSFTAEGIKRFKAIMNKKPMTKKQIIDWNSF